MHVPGKRWLDAAGLAWPAIVLTMLVACVYWPGLHGGFVFDDYPNLVQNNDLQVSTLDWKSWVAAAFSAESGTLQRPVSMLTFAIQYYATGMDPVPMKLFNVGLHALNALLVLALVRRLLATAAPTVASRRREWAARFVAAAWALHPINLMAVLFVVQRMESLSHTFVFAGLWLYCVGRERQSAGRPGWSAILGGLGGGTVLGVLSKESAVLLPLYAFCVELLVFRFRGGVLLGARLKLMYVAGLLVPMLAGGFWLLRKALQPGAYAFRDFTLVQRLLTEPRAVLEYLHWTIAPSLGQLSLYHDDFAVSRGLFDPITTLPAIVALILLLAAAFHWRKRIPLACLGVLWFLSAQALTAGVVPLELIYEHRNYFASFGVCLTLADVLVLRPRRDVLRLTGALLAISALLAFSLTTRMRALEWSDPYRFAASEAAKHPRSPRAVYALGLAQVSMSGMKPDSPYLEAAMDTFQQSMRLPNSGILPHSALLLVADQTGRPLDDWWWTDMQQRLRQRAVGPQEINAIGSLVRCVRDGRCRFPQSRMEATFAAASTFSAPAELLHMRGDYELNVLHQPERALSLWHSASRQAPSESEYRASVVKLLIALGRIQEAREEIRSLRETARFGQHERMADLLERRLQDTLDRKPKDHVVDPDESRPRSAPRPPTT